MLVRIFAGIVCWILLLQTAPKFLQFEGFEPCKPCSKFTVMRHCGNLLDGPASHPLAFSECNNGVPYNPEGTRYPASGKGYGGFHAIANMNKTRDYRGVKYVFLQREAVCLRLIKRMKKGINYRIYFALSLGQNSAFAAPIMSVAISDGPLKQKNEYCGGLVFNDTSFSIKSRVLLSDTAGWQKVSGLIRARGNESRLYIAVPADKLSLKQFTTLHNGVKASKPFGAYYFVDDIKIEEI